LETESPTTDPEELHYSPYAVLAHFQNEGWPTDTRICEKTLYSYVYEGLIPDVSVKDLFLQGKSRKSPGGKKNHRNAALAAKSITTRPEEVSTRKDFGHWEGDTVVSGKGKGSECLLTMTERKTRTEISRKIPDRSAQSVVRALDILERELGSGDFRRLFRSITFDNGPEFQDIDGIEDRFHTFFIGFVCKNRYGRDTLSLKTELHEPVFHH
jgi:IS30 family transposase